MILLWSFWVLQVFSGVFTLTCEALWQTLLTCAGQFLKWQNMDRFHVKVVEALSLGTSLAFTVPFYYVYRKNMAMLDKIDVGL